VGLSGHNVTVDGSASGANVNLHAGDRTRINGQVSAIGPHHNGGTIIATGRYVQLTGNADVSATGRVGGAVLIGGDEHGGAHKRENLVGHGVRDAQTTLIQHGAQISANGTRGAGGHVVVWSQHATEFDGAISARGTRQGDGGSAEVSSHNWLAYNGLSNLR